jgi:hypothetical protein
MSGFPAHVPDDIKPVNKPGRNGLRPGNVFEWNELCASRALQAEVENAGGNLSGLHEADPSPADPAAPSQGRE